MTTTLGGLVTPRRSGPVTALRERAGRSAPAEHVRARAAGRSLRSAPGTFLVMVVVLAVLNVLGLVMVLSASSVVAFERQGSPYYYFVRQSLWLAGGVAAFTVCLRIDYRRWRFFARPLMIGALGMLVLVLIPGVGVNANGSSRWLGVGQLSIQPAEFAKLAMLLYMADLLARQSHRMTSKFHTLRPVMYTFMLTGGLIMLQPNLGTTIVLAAITFSVLFVAGVPLGPLASWGVLGTGLGTAFSFGVSWRRQRLLAYLDPWKDPLNTGYQTIQSHASLASGGFFGVGLGASKAKWGYLPYAHTDFIFAIIGEELGLFGALVVVGLFITLGVLGGRAALDAPDTFGRLLATGITAWFSVQAFVNIGAVISVLPITGVPLPFLSFGGSSLLSTMAAAGILANVARSSSRARAGVRIPARVPVPAGG